ncbi:MAG: 1-acyl-sn-glycerol-3-phosphate acyltransferase [Gammaproteobacteria bacterium]|nr:MAG: 1-acyl-sn-glycerol-3-phosphate acyltransferase [Gammaproteobacteria bacterium]RLA54228.1 MAG: 1-acyl-sn-glycerol-3-phosphate acyltransferase [Gammaproteobacteria bacterium]
MKLILGLRSLAFYAGYVPIVIVFSILGFTVGLLLPHRQHQSLLTTANALVLWWLGITCAVKLRVSGLENIPSTPFVALSKHQSNWETFFLQRTLRPVSTILKKELLKVPFFGWGLAMTKPIAIDRSNPRSALRDILSQGKKRLSEGNNVLLYPEGTRIDIGETGNYGRSGTALAIAAQVPILPIAHNAGICWPAHKFIKVPGTVHVIIGEPLSTQNKDSKLLTEEIKQWIEANVAALPG